MKTYTLSICEPPGVMGLNTSFDSSSGVQFSKVQLSAWLLSSECFHKCKNCVNEK